MIRRMGFVVLMLALGVGVCMTRPPVQACCPAPPGGKPVVNADQTVVMIWDAATKTQHFIRQATFQSQADDFGFLIPSPNEPELAESGDAAFPLLRRLTEPEIQKKSAPANTGCGCGTKFVSFQGAAPDSVKVLQEKSVAGFQAAVLEAKSSQALVGWLKEHGYAFSPEIEAWARPYVTDGWKITALKVAKSADAKAQQAVAASALRMSFRTERPLFPYREPESAAAAGVLNARPRLLRIYFLAEARYSGAFGTGEAWSGQPVWSNPITDAERKQVLDALKLPETTGPSAWWLTEFEDQWPYKTAPGDVYFSRSADQKTFKRPPIIQYVSAPVPTDVSVYALALGLVAPWLYRRIRGSARPNSTAQ